MATNTSPEISDPQVNTVGTEVLTTPIVVETSTSKQKLPLKLIISVGALFLILLICGISIAVLAPYLKSNFVPGISPLVEDYVAAPNEQLANRLDPYFKTTSDSLDLLQNPTDYAAYMKKNASTVGVKNIANDADFTVETKAGKATASSGDFNPYANLSYTVKGTTRSKMNLSNLDNIKLTSDIDLSAELGGVTIKGGLSLSSVNNKFFIKFNSIPTLGLFDPSNLTKEWYVITPEDVKKTESESKSNMDSMNADKIKRYKDLILHGKNVFYTPTMVKSVKAAGEENSHGMTLKCYSINLDQASLASLIDEVNASIPNEEDKIKTAKEDLDTIKSVSIKLCFDKNSITIYKVGYGFEMVSATGADTKFDITSTSYILDQPFEVEEPAHPRNINNISNDVMPSQPTLAPSTKTMPEFDY